MFNAPLPRVEDLPSSARLLRSTVTSAGVAGVLLVTVLLPAEYAVDPTRIGRVLGLIRERPGDLIKVLSEPKDPSQAISLSYVTETRFSKKGIERRTVSDYGMIGMLI